MKIIKQTLLCITAFLGLLVSSNSLAEETTIDFSSFGDVIDTYVENCVLYYWSPNLKNTQDNFPQILKSVSDDDLLKLSNCAESGKVQKVSKMELKHMQKMELKHMQKSFIEKYGRLLAPLGAALMTLFVVIFVARRYSYVRTMLSVSLLYLLLIGTQTYQLDVFVLFSLPVLLFWLFRFIRHGASNVFKDKPKQ